MKKSDLKKIIAISAVALAAAAGTAVVLHQYRRYKEEKGEKSAALTSANAYILGGGMSALAAALYLVRDCGLKPGNVHLFTDRAYAHGDETTGYICRRGKLIDEKKSPNFFELMRDVRSLDIADLTVCDEILNIYTACGNMRSVTFIDNDGNVTDISDIRLDKAQRGIIVSLLREKKETLVKTSISEVLNEDFFETDFWKLIRAAYGFSETSNAYDFVNAIAHADDTLSGTMPSAFDRQEEIIGPLKAHLEGLGVDLREGATVTDIEFNESAADSIMYTDNGVRKAVYLNGNDICIFPTDELAGCETFGSFNESAPKGFSVQHLLWEKLAKKHPAFKNPSVLFEDDEANMSEEFTITLKNRLLPELIDRVTCGSLGRDGVIVLDNSSWKMTICAVPPSHFKNLSDDTAVIWGTASRFDRDGEYSKKPMTDCSGAEILFELVSCLNLAEAWDDIRDTVINVIPCHRRFDKAYLSPVESKLEIIPTGISNLAVSGDFVDGDGSVFTEEFAVTTAKRAAYTLAKSKKRIYRVGKNTPAGLNKILKKKFK